MKGKEHCTYQGVRKVLAMAGGQSLLWQKCSVDLRG